MLVVLEPKEQVHSLEPDQNNDDDVEGENIDERTDESQKPCRPHDERQLHKQGHVRPVAATFEVECGSALSGVPDLHDDVDV